MSLWHGRSRRGGFTLVELLVVIAIIGVLVGLLLPAIQAARESARRSSCTNNLKQVGLALLAHHDAKGAFPPGVMQSGSDPNAKQIAGWGWAALILPYIEEVSLHDQMQVTRQDCDTFLQNAGLRPLIHTRIPVYMCPSDADPPLLNDYRNFEKGSGIYGTGEEAHPATSNYVGVVGTRWVNNYEWVVDKKDAFGMLFPSSRITLRQVTDGTSQTMFVGERAWLPDYYAATWVGVRNLQSNGDNGLPMVLGLPRKQNPPEGLATSDASFSSWHPGGALYVFVDGHVRFIHDDIDDQPMNDGLQDDRTNYPLFGVYQKLAHRSDDQIVSSDQIDPL